MGQLIGSEESSEREKRREGEERGRKPFGEIGLILNPSLIA